jgi:hypothetical protein
MFRFAQPVSGYDIATIVQATMREKENARLAQGSTTSRRCGPRATPHPADRAMTGLTICVWADAIAHGGGVEAFRDALERKLSTISIDLVRGQLAMLRAMGQVFSPDVCRKLVDDAIGSPRPRRAVAGAGRRSHSSATPSCASSRSAP